MPRFPDLGSLKAYAGSAIKNAYGATTKTSGMSVQGGGKVRVFVKVVTDAASALTTINVKAQHAYEDVDASYIDSPSLLDTAAATREIEHAFTVAANGTYWFSFLIDSEALPYIRFDVKANAAGSGTDALTLYGRC